MFLNIAVALLVAILWAVLTGLISDARAEIFYLPIFLQYVAIGVANLAGALGLFSGLRLLARIALTRMNMMQMDDRWLGLDISIGLSAVILWTGGAALALSDNIFEFGIGRFVERTLLGAATIGCLFIMFFGLKALLHNRLPQLND